MFFCCKANIIVDLTQIVTNLSWRKLGQLQFPGLSIRLIDTFVRIKLLPMSERCIAKGGRCAILPRITIPIVSELKKHAHNIRQG